MQAQPDRQLENARTRVTRYRLAPGARIGFHRHAHDYVIVPVTSGRLGIVEGGKELFSDLQAGVTYFRNAGVEHDVYNAGDREMVFVEVEIL